MGILNKIRRAARRVRGPEPSRPPTRPSTAPPSVSTPTPKAAADEAGGEERLDEGEDVAWYLKDGGADGWENTNASDDPEES